MKYAIGGSVKVIKADKCKTSIIILTHNQLEYTKMCIDSIREFTAKDMYQIIVVDNHSTDGTIEWLKEQKDIQVILNDENLGFPKGCNQGIEAATGTDVLLLNNDVIVTQHWLENLNKCLYSSEDIGAVSAVTNYSSYYQTIPATYSNINEMHAFAQKHNISNPEQWDERIKLVAFCMLIKREVIEKIGLLDERFSPGNYEDDDYSFRMKKAGYKLLLCKDTFIHHFGSTSFKTVPNEYSKILQINREKFINKWGFNPAYSTFIRNEIIELMEKPRYEKIKVLEVGCACGATLLQIKNIYQNAELYGVELNENAADIAKTFANIKVGNIENDTFDYEEEFFDYIIFADVLEHLYDPYKVLKNMAKYLKKDGKVMASIPNVTHYSIIRSLLNGNWTYENAGILDKTHIRFFTLSEINKMFSEAGYENMEYRATRLIATKADEDFINSIVQLTNENLKQQYESYQYIVRTSKRAEQAKQQYTVISSKESKIRFLTLFPETGNVHLTKDVGMIAYIMHKYFNYDSKIVCYKNDDYPYLDKEVKGLKIEFLNKYTGDAQKDGYIYLKNNALNIDVLHLFHLNNRSLLWIDLYKKLNPMGKVYLKLDANISIMNLILNDDVVKILKQCDLISIETKYLYDYLNSKWPIRIEYIPNGFYDYKERKYVEYKEKDNTICTVGRIGLYIKATEILLEAFKLASPSIPNWKLKAIGPIADNFKAYIKKFFAENPALKEKIIFTGEITDKIKLEAEYRKAKIFCLTSRNEGFPLVFPEAAANGCYIISSNLLAAWDITDNKKYGDIFEIDNVQQLSESFVNNCRDDVKLQTVCNNIQDFSYSHFYWPDICNNINRFIRYKSKTVH
ncbi:MAG: hypothetical protein PWP27_510 [Clostridiales bacterium]|nr:hypothetical protein [Clostridiales bacterium]MDK2932700.1 hypothetical protein [Clostridiales bacterium]